jgi:hypothetical protein
MQTFFYKKKNILIIMPFLDFFSPVYIYIYKLIFAEKIISQSNYKILLNPGEEL